MVIENKYKQHVFFQFFVTAHMGLERNYQMVKKTFEMGHNGIKLKQQHPMMTTVMNYGEKFGLNSRWGIRDLTISSN